MKHAAKLAVVTILFAGISQAVTASQTEKRGAQKSEQKKKPEGASLTGCVDEQEGQYVLVDDHDPSKVIAGLEAEGFPTEGFAKHVGHKVTVRGINNPAGVRPVLKVRNIETVSESCAPQTASEGKKD